MLPALSPTQTVSRSDGRRSASPDSRIQRHRYRASPPATSKTSVSRTQGTQRSSSMLGSAVSSNTPRDVHPSSHMGQLGSRPLMKPHAISGLTWGCPYCAVGIQRALDSAIGLPSRSTSASWMLVFLTPAEVRTSFKTPPVSMSAEKTPPASENHRGAALAVAISRSSRQPQSCVTPDYFPRGSTLVQTGQTSLDTVVALAVNACCHGGQPCRLLLASSQSPKEEP